MHQAYLDSLELGLFEAGEAFKGLADANVWRRPAPNLLSVGELAGHMAYWQAIRLAGEGEDPAKCRVSSPLVDTRFRCYDATLAAAPGERHLAMGAEDVLAELTRVHRESVAHFRARNPDPESPVPGLPGWTYGEQLKYLVFHNAYHTGQIYSVRHLLGEHPPDN